MTTPAADRRAGDLFGPGEGDAHHWLGSLTTVEVGTHVTAGPGSLLITAHGITPASGA